MDLFPGFLTDDYVGWETVLAGTQTFTSNGHSGMSVRAYFNKTASPVYLGKQSLPFKEGSLLAKAGLSDAGSINEKVDKIFFMRKMYAGYDSGNGDWSYGVAAPDAGGFKIMDQGKIPMCVQCHANYRAYDHAQTLDMYWKRFGITPGPTPTPTPAPVNFNSAQFFSTNCSGCHSGHRSLPDYPAITRSQLDNAISLNRGGAMGSFSSLSSANRDSLITYLNSGAY
jgi:hypothetical protein